MGPARGAAPSSRSSGRRAGRPRAGGVLAGVVTVLRLDHDLSALLREGRRRSRPRVGRDRRRPHAPGPTVFEDVVKTVCTTNCTWSATVRMVNALVEHLGDAGVGGDGPLDQRVPDARADGGDARVLLSGRRSARATEARTCARSRAPSPTASSTSRRSRAATPERAPGRGARATRSWRCPGVGPYAAAHIMMTIGRNSRLILDSWTRPKYARLVGRKTVSDAQIRRRFARYGDAGRVSRSGCS